MIFHPSTCNKLYATINIQITWHWNYNIRKGWKLKSVWSSPNYKWEIKGLFLDLCFYLCNEQRHVVTAKLVRAVTSSCLIQRLKSHGYRNPDHSRALSKLSGTKWQQSKVPHLGSFEWLHLQLWKYNFGF